MSGLATVAPAAVDTKGHGLDQATTEPPRQVPPVAGQRERVFALVLEVAGWLLWATAVLRLLQEMNRQPIGAYDEGILLTNAELLRSGAVPYRDFYTNYPPGVFLLLAGLFEVFGPSVGVERALGVLVRAAAGLWAMRLCGQLLGRTWCSLAGGLVTAWMLCLRTEPFAYMFAVHGVLLALVAVLAAMRSGTAKSALLAGAALGAVSWFRHDLFALFAMALTALAAGAWFVARRRASTAPWLLLDLPALLLGTVLAVAAFWVPVLLLCGPEAVVTDLVIDQARYVLPSRHLPLPNVFALADGSGLPLPALLHRPFAAAVVLVLLGPVLAGLAWFTAKTPPQRLGALLLMTFALAVAPQMLGRTDLPHSVCAVAPALVATVVLVHRLGARSRRGIALAAAALLCVVWPMRRALPPGPPTQLVVQAGLERAGGRPMRSAGPRQQALQFVAEHSKPGEPVYFGLSDHRAVDTNEVDLYFFADRPGGVRWLQFDPGLLDRLDVQQRMTEDLERRGVSVAVLSSLPPPRAPGALPPGPDHLDRWLREHFEVVRKVGPYELLLRRR